LTPGPSFAHNLGDRCPNAQCEGIFDIYASRPFQWHQEHPNARCFGSYCRALNIRESRRTPNPQLFQVLGFTPTLGQVRVATILKLSRYWTNIKFSIVISITWWGVCMLQFTHFIWKLELHIISKVATHKISFILNNYKYHT